jgi:hypothetical protein
MPTYLELYANQNQVQIQHLALLNMQMQQQRQAAAFQANISQALFETERAARRVQATLRHDLFAAAVVAQGWGRRIHGVHAGLFHDVQSKHAWTNACAALDGAVRAARNDGRLAANLEGYFNRTDRHDALVRAVQGAGGNAQDPHGSVQAAEENAKRAASDLPMYGFGVAGVAFLGGLLVDGGLGALGFVAVIGTGIWWFSMHNERQRRLRVAAGIKHAVSEFVAFQESPDGGGWLRDAWTQHPLIFNEPPPEEPQAPSSQGGGSQTYVERKLVERQVVVVRCKFCKQLAPVDLPTCEHCGAPGFGS